MTSIGNRMRFPRRASREFFNGHGITAMGISLQDFPLAEIRMRVVAALLSEPAAG